MTGVVMLIFLLSTLLPDMYLNNFCMSMCTVLALSPYRFSNATMRLTHREGLGDGHLKVGALNCRADVFGYRSNTICQLDLICISYILIRVSER